MPEVKISYIAPGANNFVARINEEEISFSGAATAGSAELELSSGTYDFDYFIEGQPGSSYTIEIKGSKPDKKIQDDISDEGEAAGGLRFLVASGVAIAAAAATAAVVAVGATVAVRRFRARRKSSKKTPKKSSKKPSSKERGQE
ncbi:MAG TPA: hypothetical protein VE974_23825 [Thermoanaerobaculia bacterium]|nr:hypothetical protein [Thermoanaerobaculia bacterium]